MTDDDAQDGATPQYDSGDREQRVSWNDVEQAEDKVDAAMGALNPEAEKQTKRAQVLRALAGRNRDGKHSDKLSLLGDEDDVEYYLMLNDVGGELQDEFMDACSQIEQRTAAKYNADGEVVNEPTMERRSKLWPAIEVLCKRRIISEAVLPQIDEKTDEVGAFVWRKNPEANLAFLNTVDYLTLAQIIRVASDFFCASEGHRAAMDFFSVSRAKQDGS
jgi:hypothetical protein